MFKIYFSSFQVVILALEKLGSKDMTTNRVYAVRVGPNFDTQTPIGYTNTHTCVRSLNNN